MSQKLPEPTIKNDFMSGMISDVAIGIVPANSVALAVNLDFDEILGSAKRRKGVVQVGSQLVDGKNILGLHQHVDPSNSANNLLFAVVNAADDATATIKNVVTGADVVTGLTQGAKVRFLSYGGTTLAINGVDAPRAWNGTAWITTEGLFDLGDWPAAESSLVTEFLDRIYTNDETVPYRINYSTLFDGTAVTWDGDYVDIEPEDGGGKITAFGKVPGYVLFFKERSLTRWNFSSAFPEALVNVGTPSQESVVESGGLVFFYSNSSDDSRGFYVTNGGRPQCISKDTTRTIRRFIDAIPTANEADIAASSTDRVIQWSVGDITVDGQLYTNVVFRYNRVLNQWSLRSYPSRFMVYADFTVSGVNARIGGDNDGNVYQIDVSGIHTDAGVPIKYRMVTQGDTFGTNRLKSISDTIYVRGEKLNDLNINIIPDNNFAARVRAGASSLVRKLLSMLKIGSKVEGTTLAVELYGTGDVTISEIEFPAVFISQNYDK